MAPIALAFACLADPAIGVRGLGLAVAADVVGELALTALGGVLADRIGPQRTMVAGDLQAAAAQMALAALFLTRTIDIWLLLALSLLLGAGDALSQPAIGPMLRRLVGEQDLTAANATVRSSGTIARAISAPIGGGLILVVGAPWVLAIDAVTYLLSVALLRQARCPFIPRRGSMAGDVREGWTAVRMRPWLLALAASAAVINAARYGGITVLGPAQVSRSGGAGLWGVLVGAQAIGGVVAVWTVGQRRMRRPLGTSMASVLLVAGFLAALGAGSGTPVLLLLACASSGAVSFFALTADVVMQTHIPIDILGRVVAFVNVLSIALSPLGAAVSGQLSGTIGTSRTLLIWALVVTIAVFGVLVTPSVRRFDRVAARSPALEPTTVTPTKG
jgi:MFS family permease